MGRLLNIARGAYARSPNGLRRALAPVVALLPNRLKYGSAYRAVREEIVASRNDPAMAAREHLARLRALVAKAHAASPYYRGLVEAALGPNPDLSQFTHADLARLPVVTKADLIAAGEAALAEPAEQLDVARTSGSNTEQPFVFWLDRDRSVREIAFVHDVWARVGYGPGEPMAVLRGLREEQDDWQIEWEPALNELRLKVIPLTIVEASRYLDEIDRREIRFLYGYPTAIEVFCRHMLRLGRRPRLPLKGIMTISEPLFPRQRHLFETVLGNVPVVPFYGLSEKAAFAGELPDEPGTYEFEPLYGYAELVDPDGRPLDRPGTEGDLVATGFLSTGMPFIRYNTMDRATLVQAPSAANGFRLRVSDINPRRRPQFLVDKMGERVIAIELMPDKMEILEGIDEYQLFQDEPGRCLLKFIPSDSGSVADAERLRDHLVEMLEGRMQIDIRQVGRLLLGQSGKRSYIDQRLDMSHY